MTKQRRVVCAANMDKETGTIVLGIRHFDQLMCSNMDLLPNINWTISEQGFVDQFGNFLDRKTARVVAEASGQIFRETGDKTELYSENLY